MAQGNPGRRKQETEAEERGPGVAERCGGAALPRGRRAVPALPEAGGVGGEGSPRGL